MVLAKMIFQILEVWESLLGWAHSTRVHEQFVVSLLNGRIFKIDFDRFIHPVVVEGYVMEGFYSLNKYDLE